MNTFNLDDYKPTKSCFLDGRYVNLALAHVSEFEPNPIKIVIDGDNYSLSSDFIRENEGVTIIRVITNSHSSLLWLDSEERTATHTTTTTEHNSKVNDLLKMYVETFRDYKFFSKTIKVKTPKDLNPECNKSGFCNAYVIKQVLDYYDGKKFDTSLRSVDILRFATAIEANFHDQLDPNTLPEVEYYDDYYMSDGYDDFGMGLPIGGAFSPSYNYGTYPTYSYAPAYSYMPYSTYSPYTYAYY
jgi:hypothetical protein